MLTAKQQKQNLKNKEVYLESILGLYPELKNVKESIKEKLLIDDLDIETVNIESETVSENIVSIKSFLTFEKFTYDDEFYYKNNQNNIYDVDAKLVGIVISNTPFIVELFKNRPDRTFDLTMFDKCTRVNI